MGVVADHLDHLRARNLRPATIDQRRNVLRRFGRSLPSTALLDADLEDLKRYLAKPVLVESRATEISHLRGFYGWCVLEHLLEVDPTTRLVRPRLHRRLPRPMPTEDLQRALAAPPERIRLALFLAAYAGLRACEIAGLRVEHVQLCRNPPILIVLEGKGGATSSLPLSPVLVQELEQHMPRTGWLFPRRDGRPGHLKPWSISQLCNTYLHELGISHTLHTGRHWFGTEVYRSSGRDLRATQELLRHATPVSTAIYTYVDPGHLTDAVAGLPPLT